MATPTRQWVHVAIFALLGSTLAMAHKVKPPKADLDHVVKALERDMDHAVKPPKADLDNEVKPSKLVGMDHEEKPPKLADMHLDHEVKPPPKLADFDHAVKPSKPLGSRKLQMDNSGEDQSSQMDGSDAPTSGCDRSREEEEGGRRGEDGGLYGGGHGSGGTTFGFHNINPFPAFPFGGLVPEVSTWGEGGGYGGANPNSKSNSHSNSNSGGVDTGMGVKCHCSNGYAMHYTMSPIHFPPMGMRDGPDDMAPSSSP